MFQNVMYDIQEFIPDETYDGELDFTWKFGKITKETSDAPNGWTVQFKGLKMNDQGEYIGTIHTSWRGDNPAKLIPYTKLTQQEMKKYPDLVTDLYYKSIS